ncbi:MAG: hypothetical protein P8N05_05725 [Polaribacter sp.]|nr:hypothetical protein [Polaribacter sp.]
MFIKLDAYKTKQLNPFSLFKQPRKKTVRIDVASPLAVIRVILVNFKIVLGGNTRFGENTKTGTLRMINTENYKVKNSGKQRIKK